MKLSVYGFDMKRTQQPNSVIDVGDHHANLYSHRMRKVNVVLAEAETKEGVDPVENRSNNLERKLRYDGWVAADYTAAQLRQDVARFWQLNPIKFELVDCMEDRVVQDYTPLESLGTTNFSLRRKQTVLPTCATIEPVSHCERNDPFWLQEKLFDIFLIHSLPHSNGKHQTTISCYQFKQLVLKATSCARNSNTSVKKSMHDLTVRVVLAFKTATPNHSGAGATFDEFLDALIDVATFMFPRLSTEPKEASLEQLASGYLIPYYEALERKTVHHTFQSWLVFDEFVLVRPKVKQLLHRFAQPLFEIALAYTTSVVGPRSQRGLQFHELSRFVHDIKPRTVPLNTLEVAFCFIHCCRVELGHGFSSTRDNMTRALGSLGSMVSLNPMEGISGRGALEISCAHIVQVVAYMALLSIPNLSLAKPLKLSRGNQCERSDTLKQQHERVSTKVGVHSIKAFLYFISLQLATSGRATAIAIASATPRFTTMKKDTTLHLVAINFQQEFRRMHREDSLDDYLTSCGNFLRRDLALQTEWQVAQHSFVQQNDGDDENENEASRPEHEDNATKAEADLSLEIDWGEDESEVSGESQTPGEDSPQLEDISLTAEALAQRLEHEKEVIAHMLNDADEILTFLASELQLHNVERRLNDTETVPQMLDIWVTAGQKYAQVLTYLESHIVDAGDIEPEILDRKARVLERFGTSLYVFAMQLLRTTSKVFKYEEIFHLTNVRAYQHVASDLWNDGKSAVFTIDLATETLSLASGKLGSACKLLGDIYGHLTSERRHPSLPSDDSDVHDNDHDKENCPNDDCTSRLTCETITERYMQALFYRAKCLEIYGDVLAHSKGSVADFDLGCALEEDHESSCLSHDDGGEMPRFYTSTAVLSKTSSPGHFYRESKRIFKFLLTRSTHLRWRGANDGFGCTLRDRLASVNFKLASHVPRGCLVEKHLLDNALQQLSSISRREPYERVASDRICAKRDYISAVMALRGKFFQPETEKLSVEESDGNAIVPFYRFVLAAALREVDTAKTGLFTQQALSRFNEVCGRSPVSDKVMEWLVSNFDHHTDTHASYLTEKGVLQYFCWMAEADPFTFCEILDLLTAKHTETPVSIISGASAHGREVRGKSLRATLFSHGRQRASASVLSVTGSFVPKVDVLNGIADCVVVLGTKMAGDCTDNISRTKCPNDVRLEPYVIDVLPIGADVPDELPKFCFPDDPFMSSDPPPAVTLDIVLTDITGTRTYGSCLHFVEERDPIDVLAMISSTQQGAKTANLPSWISLKDIQQRKTKSRFFTPKCICILSRVPLFHTLRSCLATMYRLSLSMPPFPIEAFLLNILEQIPIPTRPNSITSYTLVDRIGVLSSLQPGAPQLFPHEVDFTILFQCLSPENIVKVYAFLLTERKIVLCSQTTAILTPVAETFLALAHPFESQVVYIPVLPLALIDFVTAPVPFFMGVRTHEGLERLPAEGVMVVYLDRDEISVPSTEILPTLPEVRAKKLLQSLRKVSTWAASQQSRRQVGRYQHGQLSEYGTFQPIDISDTDIVQLMQQQEDLQEKWSELYIPFTTFVMRLLKDFRKYCHRSISQEGRETTTFDKKGFLAMHPSQRDFCVHLFQTQHFQRFIDTSDSLNESILQLAASDAEQSWRSVRSKGILLRRGDSVSDVEVTKASARQITRAPPPPRTSSTSSLTPGHRRRQSGRHNCAEIFPSFNSHLYEELREFGANREASITKKGASPPTSVFKPPLLSHASSDSIGYVPRGSLSHSAAGNSSSNLIAAARLRLDSPREHM